MEARNRAVLESARSRPSSPAPASRHRRDASSDISVTRFPISTTSPTSSPARYRPHSLEVPGGALGRAEPETSEQPTLDDPSRVTAEPEQVAEEPEKKAAGGRFRKPGATNSIIGGGALARTAHANSKRDSLGADVGVVESYPGFYGAPAAAPTQSTGGLREFQLSDRPMQD